MKRLAAITLCAATAFGGTASIVASFRSPCNPGNIYGIDYYDGSLYHADGIKGGYIYQTDTVGLIKARIRNATGARGIDRTPSEFWTCNYDAWVYRLSTAGNILTSFKAWEPGYGVALGEDCLWYTQGPVVYKVTLTGSLQRWFKAPSTSAAGIYWAASYLWIADSINYYIYCVAESGKTIDSFRALARPYGVTWDGSYIWYTTMTTPYWVYKAKVNFTSIAPASLGRVKALYR